VNLPIKLSPSPPYPHALDFYVELEYKFDGCHMVSSSHPLSDGSFNPSYFGMLCSSVPDFTCDIHKDQFVDGVGVE